MTREVELPGYLLAVESLRDAVSHAVDDVGQVSSLAAQRVGGPLAAMAGNQRRHVLLRQIVEHAQPVVGISVHVRHVIARGVHAQVACEQNPLLGKVGDRVAQRVAGPHAGQLHAMLAVVEHQLVLKAHLRMLQPKALEAEFPGSGVRRPGSRILGLRFGHALARADDGGAGVHPDAVSKRVVRVIVRVEDEADRLVGRLADIGQNGLGAPGIIGVDDQHVIAEDDPAGVGDDLLVTIRRAVVDPGRQLLREVGLTGGVAKERHRHQHREGGGDRQAFHEDRILPCCAEPARLQ